MAPKKSHERKQRIAKRKRRNLKEDSDEDFENELDMDFEDEKNVVKKATKANGSHLQQKSPAEFFADNKNIAGFDNVRDPCVHSCQ